MSNQGYTENETSTGAYFNPAYVPSSFNSVISIPGEYRKAEDFEVKNEDQSNGTHRLTNGGTAEQNGSVSIKGCL